MKLPTILSLACFVLALFDVGLALSQTARPSQAAPSQAVSAAHIYGKPVMQAEAFTNFNNDWSEDPYFLKPYGDRAFCMGLTRNVLCYFVHQSTLTDIPGYQWEHVGTHFDRNVTWWPKSRAWLLRGRRVL